MDLFCSRDIEACNRQTYFKGKVGGGGEINQRWGMREKD